MSKSNDDSVHANFIEETRQFWSKRAGKEFTTEEAEEMSRRMYEFISILARWDKQSKLRKTFARPLQSLLQQACPR